ncbi:UDP-N-acetylmuramoyl-L-alanyl-D-glutamate--2,6-diaminopimelate ligase [Metabacillus lacus]|uniref:UDP-N-acetylmuramoyl-L-alanyl-D-glutamate--2, 6-diaminopimelate ligase n=1 Tax=Metabacillus lacus TaxID=1983721 RepID=UPI0012B03AD4|nr:UDP-N-acetylmuramoyl-L-alanyl-D-glutamate--2,6-diaminopimelate ligase [Metabacillus lacus]
MYTAELLELLESKMISGPLPSYITGMTMDSRTVTPGDLFLCISGTVADGHTYAEEAWRRGAVLIVAEKEIECLPPSACLVIVKNSLKAMTLLAHHFYGYPSSRMNVIGVTGTNGKTTVTRLIHDILSLSGKKAASAGTLGFLLGQKLTPSPNTTSDILSNLQFLKTAEEAGCHDAAFEVSSQGLLNGRIDGIEFDVAVFTNLTHEHLDYHRTMERYAHAKGLLFSQLGQNINKKKYAVINSDDPWGPYFSSLTPHETITYGLTPSADFYAEQMIMTERGISFLMHSPEGAFPVHTQYIGTFNVYNILAAAAALYASGYKVEKVVSCLPKVLPPAGRMERISGTDGPAVYVDYAHTPDAIGKAINSLLPFKKGKLIIMIGGGNYKDPSKRPLMAREASLADYVVITTNNPGLEPPKKILANFEQGMQHSSYILIENRAEAIRHAVISASKDDIVLLTDKGHETTLLIGTKKVPHSDKAIALEALAEHTDTLMA